MNDTSTLPDDYFEDDLDDERPLFLQCNECGGTGIAVEGWDCEECDGRGEFEI